MYTTYAWVEPLAIPGDRGSLKLSARARPDKFSESRSAGDHDGPSDGGDGQHDPGPLGGREPASGRRRRARPAQERQGDAGGSQAHGRAATAVNSIPVRVVTSESLPA